MSSEERVCAECVRWWGRDRELQARTRAGGAASAESTKGGSVQACIGTWYFITVCCSARTLERTPLCMTW
eukprot:407535-Rhodomonas_salina.1